MTTPTEGTTNEATGVRAHPGRDAASSRCRDGSGKLELEALEAMGLLFTGPHLSPHQTLIFWESKP